MADWRDQLLPGRFRWVSIDVLDAEGNFGRRGVVHEYPLRDKPWVEDLGRRARTMTLTVVMVGADYMTRRDEMLRAIESPGAANLTHPWYGEMTVFVTDCRLAESTAQGGMATFTLSLVEAGENEFPSARASTPDQVAAAAEPAKAAQKSAFAQALDTIGRPDHVAAAVRDAVTGALDKVKAAAGMVKAELAPLAELQRQVDEAKATLVATVKAPLALADLVTGAIEQLVRAVAPAPQDSLAVAKTLWQFGAVALPLDGLTFNDALAATNTVQVGQLVRMAALAEGARAAAEVDFDSFDSAKALRDSYCDAADALLLALDDAPFDALRTLRAAVVADISARGADLARLKRYTPARTLPALVLANALYGDALRADDVLARNATRIAHPLFVPGGVELEVLTNG